MTRNQLQEMRRNLDGLKTHMKQTWNPLTRKFDSKPFIDDATAYLYTKQLFDVEGLLDYIDELENKLK